MKISKLLSAKSVIATFSAGLSTIYCVPDLNAEVVELTFNGGNASTTNPFMASGQLVIFDIDQVPNVFGELGDFAAFNNSFFGSTGRTHFIDFPSGVSFNLLSHATSGIVSGKVIDPNTFDGIPGSVGISQFAGTGSAFVAFRTAAGNVGWYKLSFTTAGPVRYGPGQLGTNGEHVTVGETDDCRFELGDVNEDGEINLIDVAPFVESLTTGEFSCQADINADGKVDLLDVAPFVAILTSG